MKIMKLLLLKICLFIILLIGGAYLIFTLADGNSDPFYGRLSSPKQSSLILGTSKAAQGLQPGIINKALGRKDMYNYAFTVAHSPYGPVYLESIKNKLDTTQGKGVFIVTVDPYSVSSRREDPNDIRGFRENKLALGKIKNVSTSPNIEYLKDHYAEQYIYLITKKLSYVNDDFLHEDGWYEVNISMEPKLQKERVENKIIDYRRKLKEYKLSEIRFNYLEKAIEFLNRFGNVYLVRLPVSEPFLEFENRLDPDFNQRMKRLSKRCKVPYLNLNFNNNYDIFRYTDGNHLYKSSGEEVSRIIGEWIKSEPKIYR